MFILSCIAGVIGYIFSLIAPDQYEDNWWLVLVILLMAFEAILLLVAHTISKKVQ